MANKAPISIKFDGLDAIREVLGKLPDDVRKTVLALALRRAAAPLVKAAKAFAPRKTGALRESIDFIVRTDRKGQTYAVVGPARGRYRGGVRIKKGEDASDSDMPTKYAHLQEFGHHTPDGKFIPAKAFMRPALITAQNAVSEELAQGVSEGISKALSRLVKPPKGRR